MEGKVNLSCQISYWVQMKIFETKKFLNPKILWVQKKLWAQKNFSLKNILSQKFLAPPPIPTA